jgi:hypothetical protein
LATVLGAGSVSTNHSNDERAALERLLASETFSHAPRLQSVLSFLINAYLEGGEGDLSEQSIGRNVFGRPVGYNPADDNIVRVTIRLLRKRLEEFYAAEGRDEQHVFEIPKGNYLPIVRTRSTAVAEPVPRQEIPAVQPVLPVGATSSRPVKFGMLWMLVVLLLANSIVLSILLFRSSDTARHTIDRGLLQLLVPDSNGLTVVLTDTNLRAYHKIFKKQITLSSYIDRSYERPESAATDPALQAAWQYSVAANDTSVSSAIAATAIQRAFSPSVVTVRHPHDLSTRDLQQGNFVLLGGPEVNPWQQLFEPRLNFRIILGEPNPVGSQIRNLHPLVGEPADFTPHQEGSVSINYVRIALLPNLSNSGHVILLGATSGAALESGGKFLINQDSLTDLLHRFRARTVEQLPPFEIVLEIKCAGAIPTSARIIAQRPVQPQP